jgi:hypothetical protein
MKAQIRPIMISLLLFTAAWLFLQELTNESTSILYGKCTRLESAWTEDKSMILTRVTVVPEQYLKGNLGNEVTITVPGGQVGDIIYEVSEMPAFQKGEEVFAFIWQNPSGMNLVTGGYQGKLKIRTDAKTGTKTLEGRQLGKIAPRKLPQAPTITGQVPAKAAKAPTLPQPKSERISLDDFTKEVQGYLNQR